MEPSLVEQAKEQKKQSKYTRQDVDLAIAFLKGEIPMQSLLNVKSFTQYVNGQVFISAALKFGVRSGYLKLEIQP